MSQMLYMPHVDDNYVRNNVDGKCYFFGEPLSLNDNNACEECYMPEACPQSTNFPLQWIFNMPNPYAAQLELNDYLF